MAHLDLPKSPNVFHPEKPSAVGSRNSLAQEFRDQQNEVDTVIKEEVDKVMNHVITKMPKTSLEKLDVMGGIKEKLYNYFNQNYQNMFNRFMTTSEDEMVKKVRNFVDKEEMKTLARYTPREIAALLDQIGGMDKFNTGEIEKSMINMFGHLQGHIQRGMNDLENETNALLRQKVDVGAFIRGENAYSISKCAFKDNIFKPKTVSDVKLSVNILDSELISPIFHYQTTINFLIKELISKHIMDLLEREIEQLKDTRADEGKEDLTDTEIIFEKFKKVGDYTSDDLEDEKSSRYSFVAKAILEKLDGLRAEISQAEYDQLNIRENLKKILDIENIRNRGFNTAVNSITSILDTSKMGYQFIENLKNARDLVIREYEDTTPENLPDERYQVRLTYYDQEQLSNERKAYDKQYQAIQSEILRAWDVIEELYQKRRNKVIDYNDLAGKLQKTINGKKAKLGLDTNDYNIAEKEWTEVNFIKAESTDVQKLNNTYLYEKEDTRKRFMILREKLQRTFKNQNPVERLAVEERIEFLYKEFSKFDYMINPYHIQPGLVLDVDITSIKRKKYTLNSMANVLNEFLHGVSKGFQDAAFASFSRRRSTVRADINQSFGSMGEDEEAPAYQVNFLEESSSSGNAPEGIVDVSTEDDGMTEI
ncbi:MAG: cytochrome C oxidase subunit II [Spirochaetes bacterium GWF1_31_7]|nr:MAG: cytochrome C oxidase subunit II [Spirochaetes bacterium GWE1_32_154]OHD50146.1 MAG: cytochrome C oxidase subunit II [Spirochaetes bacterium GWE2_31_10]OHD52460.1 MAG: cytochrome C oxidase subunit II [Spirochaetes bacterium GWF1_31_7]OHD81954.1 MAG: cytochrome C oxidase subunit II [Spirochaetes bacterium RIFOXYB1_FULL_32_8]HBD96107.1 cytochrome C oxidase subunit II [Spirochaetia bacterium]